MNFLAHYYFDRKTNEPYFNFGLLLPDLLRNFIRKAKIKEYKQSYLQIEHEALKNGCQKHIASDKLFHQWDGFIEGMDLANNLMRTGKVDFEKDFFLSHIFVELVIDKILLTKNPNLANELYSDYDLLELDDIKSFLEIHTISSIENFELGFNRFMNVRYLVNYSDFSNIVYALGRIGTKMGLQPFTEDQKSRLTEIAQELETALDEKMPALHLLLQEA